MYNVYFARSIKNNKIYVGLTSKEPETRVKEHNSGSSMWTRKNGSFELVYYETFLCKPDAQEREKFYKTGFGKKIKSIIVNGLLKGMGR